MAVVNEVSTVSHIPQFVPFGLLYYTQDTGDLYIGTGFSTGSDYVGGNPGPNVNVELISSPGGLPGGFNGDIQYNNNGNLGGSAATITAAGAINALSITATTATVTSTLELQTATIVDSLGSTGTVGQALESTGTGVKWAAVSSTETWAALTGAMTATQVAPWYNATSTIDSGISRLGAASLAIGNGTAGDFTGSLGLAQLSIAAGGAALATTGSFDIETTMDPNGAGVAFNYTNHFASASVVRSQLFPWGGQFWYLNSGIAEVGQISYSTPGGHPGIVFYTGSTQPASNFRFDLLRGATGGVGGNPFFALQNNYTGHTDGIGISYDGTLIISSNSMDSGISRLGAASLAIGNGTAGNSSGALLAAVHGFGATATSASPDTGISRSSCRFHSDWLTGRTGITLAPSTPPWSSIHNQAA